MATGVSVIQKINDLLEKTEKLASYNELNKLASKLLSELIKTIGSIISSEPTIQNKSNESDSTSTHRQNAADQRLFAVKPKTTATRTEPRQKSTGPEN